jgi:D-alanine--D-alanine ligase
MTTVAVLMGGPSAEHEISLKSGQGIAAALGRRAHRVLAVSIPQALSVKEAEAFVRCQLEALKPEVVFIALHGTFGEDGTIQQLCEALQLPYTGSDPAASRAGMDKIAAKQLFERAGLRVPRAQTLDLAMSPGVAHVDVEALAYPLVVKPASQGSSFGVSLVREPQMLAAALEEAARYGSRLLIEEFIAGRELTVGVLNDEALPVVEIRSPHAFFDFGAKYTPGATEYLVPAPLDPAMAKTVQAAGVAAHRALGCRHVSRTDLILNAQGEPVVLEVNTVPGFTPTSLLPKAAAQAGISYDALCDQLVLMALHHHTPLASAS